MSMPTTPPSAAKSTFRVSVIARVSVLGAGESSI